mgnify:CR=1 FL=1
MEEMRCDVDVVMLSDPVYLLSAAEIRSLETIINSRPPIQEDNVASALMSMAEVEGVRIGT